MEATGIQTCNEEQWQYRGLQAYPPKIQSSMELFRSKEKIK